MSTNSSINPPRGINRIGQEFDRLRVIAHAGRSKDGENIWECECRCGNKVKTLGSSLRKKKTRSCGCLNRDEASRRALQHGHSRDRSPTYRCWATMIQRCRNKRNPQYKNYGGRGINVCEPWIKFVNFLTDMGLRPSELHSIDRFPDNDGNYEPGNCRWATDAEQSRNKRTNHFLEFGDKRLCIADWGQETGYGDGVIYNRLRNGWSVEKTLTTPVRRR